ncbi:tRNA pseudouridine(13) synthase TruD [Endozoicomonas arenosclerae]|uniref:tRNA pseudouridine(13) synthase TruD n=1 Tax=Endozoicomonas arenosclerae TaxID=1633495 RepID=UPI0009A1F6FB|nr:tRNA pseudouridine(13) synthase TruD [Endozoicomonas arenosclerae]
MNQVSYTPAWAFAWGGPLGQCQFKSLPEDFIVEEELPFEPDGEGEHAYINVQKTGENTDWVAGQLARFAGVKRSAVSYAGRKDRHGVTRQWFSVWLPGQDSPEWSELNSESLVIISATRHGKKLKTGALKGNRFLITLREVGASKESLDTRLNQVSQQGVPNYFGEQRFGHEGINIDRALLMFSGSFRAHRNKRSMYLSAARSWLFNQIVAERVEKQSWLSYQDGDVPGFQDSGSLILRDHDDLLMARIRSGEVSLTAPLWGRGELLSSSDCRKMEEDIAGRNLLLTEGLEKEGLKQERRAIRLIPNGMSWQWLEGDILQLEFSLPKGCFATAVLREVLECIEGRFDENTAE